MFQDLSGNLLVLQCGLPCATSNACLAGIIAEALNHEDHVEDILGALGGIQGLIGEDFIDLAEESQQTIRSLGVTPGAALGTTINRPLRAQDADQAITVLEAHNIRYVLAIGNGEAVETVAALTERAEAKGYKLAAIAIPASAENNLPLTDHCIGYGSLAKHIASSVKEVACVCESLPRQNQVVLVEVAGRLSGWSTAATTLARRKNQADDAPHLVYLPEVHFNPEKFIENVRSILEKQGWCMASVSEGLVDADGNFLAGLPSEGGSVSEILARLLREQLGVSVSTVRLGLSEVASGRSIALIDAQEATVAGAAAVVGALDGKTGRMVTLSRAQTETYKIETSLAVLSDMGTTHKSFPATWINEDGSSLSYQFSKYALPLIQGEVEAPFEHGVVKMARLDKRRIAKKKGISA